MKVKLNFVRAISLLLTVPILMASCASTTMIQSNPSGARVFIDGQSVGTTPYPHTDTKIVGSVTTVRLEKEGYKSLNTTISRSEQVDIGAIIAGFIVWIPFLWIMKYNPAHTYDLIPGSDYEQPAIKSARKSKPERLRELKQLMDEKIISQEEFEKEKKKILEEDEK